MSGQGTIIKRESEQSLKRKMDWKFPASGTSFESSV